MRLIDGDAITLALRLAVKQLADERREYLRDFRDGLDAAANACEEAPTIDAVPVEQYNNIREDFVDYVCSGVPNPAPYCGNATEKCVDARGWCVNSECKGFAPRVERKE